jgi:hypothetical protein
MQEITCPELNFNCCHYAGFGPGTVNIFRQLLGLEEVKWIDEFVPINYLGGEKWPEDARESPPAIEGARSTIRAMSLVKL